MDQSAIVPVKDEGSVKCRSFVDLRAMEPPITRNGALVMRSCANELIDGRSWDRNSFGPGISIGDR
jgi:hypothetical protein